MAENILSHSFAAYSRNIRMISFFSIPAFIGLLIPLLVNTPVFSALGATFLRTGSIPDLSAADFGVILLSLLASLYLVSFAIVNINIVIKAQRTGTSVKNEVVKGITGYTLNVFILFLLGTIALLIIQLLTLELGAQNLLAPILSLLVWLPLFYAPAGLVIDELRPWRAAEKSFKMVFSKFNYFALWLAISFVLLSLLDLIFLNLGAVFPVSTHKIGSLFVLLINSLVLMPFLVVLQTEIYISKYSILD
ncbi:TPA: hypothetical protein HA243_01505 [Candidatus Micrarchaeota archaeon]|nr:hypothetical protein [Candidatus Micrarchaeota archaeon]